jgi:hypothetical protein
MTGQACPLRLVARYEDRGYDVASGSRSAPGVPLKISMVTPRSAQGVEVADVNPAVLTAEHHAVLALLCPRKGLVEVRGGAKATTATWWTPSPFSARKRA